MTSPESTSDSSYDSAGVPLALATNDAAVDPGSTLPRHQTSLLGIDIAPGQMTANTLARPVMSDTVSHAATRVMSPNTMRELENDYANPMMERHTSMLLGQHVCQLCSGLGPDMMVCAECGTVGHMYCLKMQLLEGFWFCQTCYGPILGIHDRMWAEQKAQELQFHSKNQLRSWKKMALDTLAASTSIGIAIGSATVMAAGAATALAQGIQQGVENASVDRSQVSPDISIVDSRRPGSLANSIVDARRRVANVFGLLPEDSFQLWRPIRQQQLGTSASNASMAKENIPIPLGAQVCRFQYTRVNLQEHQFMMDLLHHL